MKYFFIKIVESKILLTILAILTLIFTFNLWMYKQEQYRRSMAEQKNKCEESLKTAANFVRKSKILSGVRMKLVDKNKIFVEQPGINRPFDSKDREYILIYTKPHSLIPKYPIYGDQFFQNLAKIPNQYPPPPLLVSAQPLSNKMAIVFSECSPRKFEVSLDDLYTYFQKSDANVPLFYFR